MRIVSPFLKKVLYPSLFWTGIFRHTAGRGLAVVTYHGVLPYGYERIDPVLDGNLVNAEMLRRHLRLLKAHYDVISPEDVLAWREGRLGLPPRAVLLTCDDGLRNNLTDMLPVLQREAVRCLFFVTGASASERAGQEPAMLWYEELFLLFLRAAAGGFEISCDSVVIKGELGRRKQRRALWWSSVRRLSQVGAETRGRFLRAARSTFGLESWRYLDEGTPSLNRFGLLTGAELRELVSAGMTIGAHTLSHPILSQAPPDVARAEIAESRVRLESTLQTRVWAFAYPFGDPQSVTAQVVAMAGEAGYEAAFLNFGGGLGAALPPYALPRVHVMAEMGLAELEAHVSGFHGQLQECAGRMKRCRTQG